MSTPLPLPKASKGGRPQFLDTPDSERLLTMVVALAGEISLLHDKLDSLARVASEKSTFSLDEVNRYAPDAQVLAERAVRREAFLGRVFRILHAEAERAARPEAKDYAAIMAMVARETEPS